MGYIGLKIIPSMAHLQPVVMKKNLQVRRPEVCRVRVSMIHHLCHVHDHRSGSLHMHSACGAEVK